MAFFKFKYSSTFLLLVALSSCQREADPPVINEAPTTFSLISPANGKETVVLNPTLAWGASEDPEGGYTHYDIFLDTVNPPSQLLEENIRDTSLEIFTELEPDTRYFWQVVAKDIVGNQTQSDIFSFSTELTLPEGKIYMGGNEYLTVVQANNGATVNAEAGHFVSLHASGDYLFNYNRPDTQSFAVQKRNLETGALIWDRYHVETDEHYYDATINPVVFGDFLYYSYVENNKISPGRQYYEVLINHTNGEEMFHRPFPEGLGNVTGRNNKRQAIVDNGNIYTLYGRPFYSSSTMLRKLNLETLEEETTDLGERIAYTRLYHFNDLIVFSSWENKLYAYNKNLELQWQTNLSLALDLSFANGTIYAGTRDEGIVAIDADSGSKIWSTTIGLQDPQISIQGSIISAYSYGTYYRLRLEDGEILTNELLLVADAVPEERGNVWSLSEDFFLYYASTFEFSEGVLGLYNLRTNTKEWEIDVVDWPTEAVDGNFTPID